MKVLRALLTRPSNTVPSAPYGVPVGRTTKNGSASPNTTPTGTAPVASAAENSTSKR